MRELTEIEIKEIDIEELITHDGPVVSAFTSPIILNKLLTELEKEIISRWDHKAVIDENTEKGRKTLISRARSIASVSAKLDEIGKQEVAKLKDLPKQVDAGRRRAREFFENWKELVREPVNKWEEKQKQVMALAQVILDHEQALIDNEIWDKVKEEKAKAEQEMQERLRAELKEEIKQEVNKELCQLSLQTEKEAINIGSVDLTQQQDTTTCLAKNITPNRDKRGLRELCLFVMDTIDVDYSKALKLIQAIEEGKTPYLKRVYEGV